MKIRNVLVVIGLVAAATAYASCDDIKANCSREFQADLEYCNRLSSQSQENCFARAHERLRSCVGDCK